MQLTVLGSRGSIPVARADEMRYGGETSCYQVDTEGATLFLDAGTGLRHAVGPFRDGTVHILISHAHADHLLGLLMFSGLTDPAGRVILYGRDVDGIPMADQLDRLISPPIWPLSLSGYPARTEVRSLVFPLRIGPFTVTGMDSCHPGGSAILRVEAGGKSLVYATDFEHTDRKLRELASFAAGCDLLMYDAQYTPLEYEQKKGFGHSTAEMGLRAQRDSGAKRLLLIHHDPGHSDDCLRALEAALPDAASASYAREGEVIQL